MYQVVGIEEIQYKSKSTGKDVKGKKLHLLCSSDSSGKNCKGNKVETVFVGKDEIIMGLDIGDKVSILYNKYGSVDRIELIAD